MVQKWEKGASPIGTTAGVFLSIFLVTSGTKLFTLFFPEFERQGIPMTIVSLASVAATVAIFVSGLYIGKIIRAMGMKRMMLLGCALMAAAYLQFAFANPVILFSGFICLGVATTLCGYTPASLIITNWYDKGRALALSVVFTGMTLGTALYSSLCGVLLTEYGMKITALIVGGCVFSLGFPAILLLVKEAPAKAPSAEAQKMAEKERKTDKPGVLDISEKEAGKTSLFLLILFVTLLAAGLLSTVQSYIPSHLQNEGMSILQSSQVYSVMMLAGTFGTILGGILADRFGTRVFILYTSALSWIATWLLIFNPTGQGAMFLAAAMMGLAYPLCTVTPSLLMSDTFGQRACTGLLGLVQASTFVSIGIFFPVTGFLYRWQGTYRWAFTLINLLMVVMVVAAMAATSDKIKQKTMQKLKCQKVSENTQKGETQK